MTNLFDVLPDLVPIPAFRALERRVIPRFRGRLFQRIAAVPLQRGPVVSVPFLQPDLDFCGKDSRAGLKPEVNEFD